MHLQQIESRCQFQGIGIFMKALVPICLITAVSTGIVFSADTNDVFVTDDGLLMRGGFGSPTFPDPEKVKAARLLKECQPADQDPEGNWGSVSEGFQMSVRFEKESFEAGEPIPATIITRNVTQEFLWYPHYSPNRLNIKLFVINGEKKLIPRRDEPKGNQSIPEKLKYAISSVDRMAAFKGTQRKQVLDLNDLFDLSTPGTYVIYASRAVPKLNSDERSVVISGNATIRITNQKQTSDQKSLSNFQVGTTALQAPASTADNKSKKSDTKPSELSRNAVRSESTNINLGTNQKPAAQAGKTPAPLAQAGTSGGWSNRDWVYGLLVFGLMLGLGWYLFRARSPQPRN